MVMQRKKFQELRTNTSDLAKQTIEKATALGATLEGEQLKKVHEICVTSLKDFQSGVDQLIQAVENEDDSQLSQVNDLMSKANEEGAKYMEELKKLAEELDVEMTTE